MDLSLVLATGTDERAHPVLRRYFTDIFSRYLQNPPYEGALHVWSALNFGVHQLATRSRVSPDTERYLQVCGFSDSDLPAALIEAMPHTRVACCQPHAGTQPSVAALRQRLPPDAMPTDIHFTDGPFPTASFGLVAVFSEAASPDLSVWHHLLNPAGRILLIRRPHAHVAPMMSLHDA